MDAPSYRPAAVGDAADIFALMQEAADEIPLLLDTLAREEAMYARVRNWARSGESWVALDGDRLVGFVLAELNQTSRFWGEHPVIDVHYAAVAKDWRNRGVFTALMQRIRDRLVPVTAAVNPENRSAAARRLEHLGFRRASPGEPQFVWEPGGGAS
ncbi:MAG TPA: GNAT family N-acetyltransferase [Stellaceae bacterium]|nr:GNAT family N-acetyltransferase [Stellaceae bacterium]